MNISLVYLLDICHNMIKSNWYIYIFQKLLLNISPLKTAVFTLNYDEIAVILNLDIFCLKLGSRIFLSFRNSVPGMCEKCHMVTVLCVTYLLYVVCMINFLWTMSYIWQMWYGQWGICDKFHLASVLLVTNVIRPVRYMRQMIILGVQASMVAKGHFLSYNIWCYIKSNKILDIETAYLNS